MGMLVKFITPEFRSSNRHCWRLLDVGAMFVYVFERRACRTANFNAARSIVANHEDKPSIHS